MYYFHTVVPPRGKATLGDIGKTKGARSSLISRARQVKKSGEQGESSDEDKENQRPNEAASMKLGKHPAVSNVRQGTIPNLYF